MHNYVCVCVVSFGYPSCIHNSRIICIANLKRILVSYCWKYCAISICLVWCYCLVLATIRYRISGDTIVILIWFIKWHRIKRPISITLGISPLADILCEPNIAQICCQNTVLCNSLNLSIFTIQYCLVYKWLCRIINL